MNLPLILFPGAAAILNQVPNLVLSAVPMPSALLAVTFTSSEIIGLVAIVGGLLLAGTITIFAMRYHTRRQEMWHQTARIALEKGQPVPPRPLSDEELVFQVPGGISAAEWEKARRADADRNDFKGGLVLVAVGAGLYVMMGSTGSFIWAIPAFIGVALLVNALLTRVFSRKNASSENRPPQS